MKKIAVIGAGFAGLGVAFHLVKNGCQVTLIDAQGVGSGASGIAAGILHPYPGEHARRTWKATEGLQETLLLLDEAQKFSSLPVAEYQGVLRKPKAPGQVASLIERSQQYEDFKQVNEDTFFITSGVLVHCPLYLPALWAALKEKGVLFERRKVSSKEDLKGFDAVVYCLGYGVKDFPLSKKPLFTYRKGQLLKGVIEPKDQVSSIPVLADGYIVKEGDTVIYGATYEREFDSVEPCLEVARQLLLPRLPLFIADLECSAILI